MRLCWTNARNGPWTQAMNDTPTPQKVQLEITWKSVMRVLLGVLLAYLAVLLWPIVRMLVLAILIAVALSPLVSWARRKGWPRWVGVLLASATLLVVVVGCFAIIGPEVFRQAASLSDNLPKVTRQILAHLPPSGPVRQALEGGLNSGTIADSRLVLERALSLVESTAGLLFRFTVVIVLAIYLLADGPRAVKWLIVFFPAQERQRISQGLSQVAELIFGYVVGQCLVSALCAAYVFLLLTLLGVPKALLLGVIAGICDVVPILGFCVAVCLAMLMALTVSPTTALLVFLLYGAYHLFENFVVVPRVYGKKLKLSKLAVPLAVAAGGLVAGAVGAIAVLPLVAAYPVVERLWLAPKLEPDTVKAHEERDVC
jgi:predicted PurR-regulated permease PerM